jgi:hypothetical protein
MGLAILGSWQLGESGNIAGVKLSLARVVEGGRSLFGWFFRKEHTVRRASHIPKFVS